jgi:hypothetical protein
MTIPYSSSALDSNADVRVSDINGLNFDNLSTSRLIKKDDTDNFGDASLETAVGAHGHSIKCYDSTGTEVSQMLFNSNGFEIAGIDNTKPLLHFGYSGFGIGQVINLIDLSFFNNTLTLRNSSAATLTIHPEGKIGLGSSPNYGNSGAVLTSNGDTGIMSWNRPYFIKAKLTSSTDINGENGRNNDKIMNLQEQFTAGSFAYNSGQHWSNSNSEWTCPKDGIYRITGQISFESGQGDRIRDAALQVIRLPNGSATEETIGRSEYDFYATAAGSTPDNADKLTPNTSIMVEVNSGDKIFLQATWSVDDTSSSGRGIEYVGHADIDYTFITIERVI